MTEEKLKKLEKDAADDDIMGNLSSSVIDTFKNCDIVLI